VMILPKRVQAAIARLLGPAGKSGLGLRHSVFEHGRTGVGELEAGARDAMQLREFLEKIDEQPWAMNSDDFVRLRDAGYSEDELFELTLAAAAGAAVRRFEAGLRALESARQERAGSPSAVTGHAPR